MSENTPVGDAPAMGGEDAAQARFGLQRIYVKDISFESPRAPEVFRGEWKPRMKLDLNSRSQRLADDTYEVVLTVTIEARDDEDRVAYICELQQAGVFSVGGLPQEQLAHTLSSFCPSILFPYARETVDTLVVKGSFPALMLAPVNFDALYAEALQRREQDGGAAAAAGDEAVQH